MSSGELRAAATAYPWWLPTFGAAILAVGAGALVVALEAGLGHSGQRAAVVALALALPTLLLCLTRPRVVLLAYLLVLPLVMPAPVAVGLNTGEVLTLGVLLLATLGLWHSRTRVTEAASVLAPILWPLAGFALVSVASVLVNEVYTLAGISSAVFKAVSFGVVAVLVYIYADTRSHALALLLALLLGGVAVGLYSIFSYLMGWTYSATYDWHRAAGTFTTWNHLGGFMALVSVPTLAFAFITRRPALRALLLVGFVAQITALLLSLTAGSVVALAVGAVIGALFIFKAGWRRVAAASFLALAGFAVALATNPLLRAKFANLDDRIIDRLRTYQVGLSMFRDHFWFGFGSPERVEAILLISDRYGMTSLGETSTVPHNSLLLMGVEKGVFGLILFTLLVAASVWLIARCRRAFEGSSLALLYQGLVVGMLAFLVQSMTNNLVVHARLGILFFAMVALTVRLAEMAQGEETVEEGGRAPPVVAGQ